MNNHNLFSLSKTLRFSLIPVGRTEENFDMAQVLKSDEHRAEIYSNVKGYIDKYHRWFIEDSLSTLKLCNLKEYAQLYYKKDTSVSKEKELLENNFRKAISKHFSISPKFETIFKKQLIEIDLPAFLSSPEEIEQVKEFIGFSSYFRNFSENRKNVYKADKKPTAIAYRCIHDNLPRFLDNVKNFERVKEVLADKIYTLSKDISGLCAHSVEELFSVEGFNFVLTQKGISEYNSILGGYSTSDSKKIQGLNEYINQYNQTADKGSRLPFMKMLYKQILSVDESISYVPEAFFDDNQVLKAINEYCNSIQNKLHALRKLADNIEFFNDDGIFVKNDISITKLSQGAFGDWSAVSSGWETVYDSANEKTLKKNYEKHCEKRRKAFKAIKAFSLREIDSYGNMHKEENHCSLTYIRDKICNQILLIEECYRACKDLISNEYTNQKRLSAVEESVEKIKSLLDSIKALEIIIKMLIPIDLSREKDEFFYGEIVPIYDCLSAIDKLYDKVRSYITKKPYSTDKIKLNFDNPQLLGGWDRNKESDYQCVLLRKSEKVFLAIMDKASKKAFENIEESTDIDCYEKMECKFLPDPNKTLPRILFSDKRIEYYAPSEEINRIYTEKSFTKGDNFNIDDCHKLIDFYKESINKNIDWCKFGFNFKETSEYNNIGEFYNDIKMQGYKIKFKKVSASEINNMVENGYIYLFQLYNKDFSERSKGTPNLHTLYFKMMFDEKNLKDVVYKLNGKAEMFYRKPSIGKDEMIVHPANVPIKRKSLEHRAEDSLFVYDITKDKRYTKRQFLLHLPITLNFKAEDISFSELNYRVRKEIKDRCENYVIGIDRGERNLIYICVINSKGEIVEQKSLNEIISGDNRVDYQKLLTEREDERQSSRQAWKQINSIKELKEGYLSQVVNEICKLVVKYDAVISMEDLNMGFKNSRIKVERQVYQKFEKMLINKLEYVVDKNTPCEAEGGLLKAYQFAMSKTSGRQNGRLLYVPAWLTSKIDPVTGFVNLLRPKYTTIEDTKSFIEQLDDVFYDSCENMFVFRIDYSKFKGASIDFKKTWAVYTNGERIEAFRNKEKNNAWDTRTIVLTDEFKALFNKYGISYENNLKEQLISQSTKEFFATFMHLLSLTLQVRNSIPNDVNVDYLISPVKDESGHFYDSREQKQGLPQNADANGAFNIARKALWIINQLKSTADDQLIKADIFITQQQWLEYAQK